MIYEPARKEDKRVKKDEISYILYPASCEKGLLKEVKTHHRPWPQREGMRFKKYSSLSVKPKHLGVYLVLKTLACIAMQ